MLDYSLENNMVLQRYWQPEFQKGGFIQSDKVREYSDKLIAQYDVRSGQGSSTIVRSMSGGNQQKVLIARWLANNPDVLILDEPPEASTSVQKYEIYCIIADLAKQGKSIIMISSEMSEIIGMSNRVMVMCDGRITGFIDGKDATQENIMALATQFETAPEAAAANQ